MSSNVSYPANATPSPENRSFGGLLAVAAVPPAAVAVLSAPLLALVFVLGALSTAVLAQSTADH